MDSNIQIQQPQMTDLNLNPSQTAKTASVLDKLQSINSLTIKNDLKLCRVLCWWKRDFSVLDPSGSIIFHAEELRPGCPGCICQKGYCLFYKLNNEIFANLGYQVNCLQHCCYPCKMCCIYCQDCCNVYLTDVREVTKEEDAHDFDAGKYKGTLKIPCNCCCVGCGFCCCLKFGYTGYSERYYLQEKCCQYCCCYKNFDIVETKTGTKVGEVKWTWPCCPGTEIFEVKFPDQATPMEKFMLISTCFMVEHTYSISICGQMQACCTKKQFEPNANVEIK